MLSSLSKLRELPEQTQVRCADEFTLRNLQFALTVDADNPDLHERLTQVKATRSRNEATIPSLIGQFKNSIIKNE
ncbi:MAG TPA: hydroxyacylglutathione hydrolase C-terminal domain-containing protein [Vampirovibrionales bacterium]